jgi:hypothetical protein
MRSVFIVLALIFCQLSTLIAQDTTLPVTMTEIDITRFPTVLLKLQIRKQLNSSITVSANNATLSENGILQTVEFLDCPQDSNTRLSLAILLDRSGSMTRDRFNRHDPDSTKIREAKKAISTFLDLLGPRDEAGIFSFTTENFTRRHIFTIDHDFSFDIPSLQRSLVPIVAEGGTRLWEAIIDAVDLLRVRPGRKALIVVTDGRNQDGNNYRNAAFQNAVNEGIPVFPIGLGDDIDVGALSSLASATGGKFYPAPDVADLEDIFNQIGADLITDDCVLRYTSSNTCLDGSRRDIDLTISGLGFFGEADSFYVLPRMLNPVTLLVESGVTVTARDTAVIPLTVLEQFSTAQPLTYTIATSYDNSIMRFLGIRTDGTMSEGQTVTVAEGPPGVLRLELINFLPAYSGGSLCELAFETYVRSTDTSSAVTILDASIVGVCPMELTLRNSEITIRACEEMFTLGTASTWIASDGEEVLIPVRIRPIPKDGAPFDLEFTVAVDAPFLEFLGVVTEGTLATAGNMLAQHTAGVLTVSLLQVQSALTDTVVFLRFRAQGAAQPSRYTLDLRLQSMITGCSLQSAVENPLIMIDGLCEPIVRRKSQQPSLANYPNPFLDETNMTYSVTEEGFTELFILDGSGRNVRTLLSAWLVAGEYQHSVDFDGMPAGEYLAVLRTGARSMVRRLLLLK